MDRLKKFQVFCIALLMVSVVAVYFEVYVFELRSLTALYGWAGVAIVALVGNAVAAVVRLARERNGHDRPL